MYKNKGFTLIELIVVIGIIAMFSAMVLVGNNYGRNNYRVQTAYDIIESQFLSFNAFANQQFQTGVDHGLLLVLNQNQGVNRIIIYKDRGTAGVVDQLDQIITSQTFSGATIEACLASSFGQLNQITLSNCSNLSSVTIQRPAGQNTVTRRINGQVVASLGIRLRSGNIQKDFAVSSFGSILNTGFANNQAGGDTMGNGGNTSSN